MVILTHRSFEFCRAVFPPPLPSQQPGQGLTAVGSGHYPQSLMSRPKCQAEGVNPTLQGRMELRGVWRTSAKTLHLHGQKVMIGEPVRSVAQLAERRSPKPVVGGSSPPAPARHEYKNDALGLITGLGHHGFLLNRFYPVRTGTLAISCKLSSNRSAAAA